MHPCPTLAPRPTRHQCVIPIFENFGSYVQATGYTHRGDIHVMKVIKKGGAYYCDWGDTDEEASWDKIGFVQGAEHPVVGISWQEAKAFCTWLTEKERAESKIGAG